MANLQVRFKNSKQIWDRLQKINDNDLPKIARPAVKRAMQPVAFRAQQNFKAHDRSETSNDIAANVTVVTNYQKDQKIIRAKVGVRGGAMEYGNTADNRRKNRVGKSYHTDGSSDNPGGDTWYWRFLELGNSRQRAFRPMGRAIDGHEEEVSAAVYSELKYQVDRMLT